MKQDCSNYNVRLMEISYIAKTLLKNQLLSLPQNGRAIFWVFKSIKIVKAQIFLLIRNTDFVQKSAN